MLSAATPAAALSPIRLGLRLRDHVKIFRNNEHEVVTTLLAELTLSWATTALSSFCEVGYKVRRQYLNVNLNVLVLEEVRREAQHAGHALGERIDDSFHVCEYILKVLDDRAKHADILNTLVKGGHLFDENSNGETVAIPMCSIELCLNEEDDLAPKLEVALEKLCVLAGHDSRDNDVD